jgi:hypothetical protein
MERSMKKKRCDNHCSKSVINLSASSGEGEKKNGKTARERRGKNAATLTVENTTTIKAVKRGAAKNGFERFYRFVSCWLFFCHE